MREKEKRTSLVSNRMNYRCVDDEEVVERIEERIVEDSPEQGTVAEDNPAEDNPAVDNRVAGILAADILAVDILVVVDILLPFRIPPADNLKMRD